MSKLHKYLNSYEFEFVLPISGEEVKYKGLSTNMMKKLIMYEDETDILKGEDILDEIINLSVISEDWDIDKQYVSDRYTLFVKIREATKGSMYQFKYKCPRCSMETIQSIDLSKLEIVKPDEIEKELPILNGNVTFHMSHPLRKRQKKLYNTIPKKKMKDDEKRVEIGLTDIASYVEKIVTKDEGEINITDKELINFIGDLPETELDNIKKWQEKNRIGLDLTHKIKCRGCKKTEERTIDFQNFFT